MDQDQQSRWLWAGVGVVSLAILIIVICGYVFGLQWTGVPRQTFWDWLDLLIIPVVLALGGYLFTRSENRATQAAAEQRAQEEALQAYLNQMSDMLIPNNDQPSLSDERPPNSLKTVARARTLTVLPRLGADRKARVVQFLYESGLITKDRVIVDLRGADLQRANLSGGNLSEANLRETDLSRADLIYANLSNAELSNAELSNANLRRVRLGKANLQGAKLTSANLRLARLDGADLSRAELNEASVLHANLTGAILRWAKLGEADLSYADLRNAKGWTKEQLAAAESLTGAIMPDGRTLKGDSTPHGPTFNEWRQSR